MVLLTEKIAQILKCRVSELRDRLNHPAECERVLQALNGQQIHTTYKDRNGFTKSFIFGGLTPQGASTTLAYGRLGKPFNVNVAAHFYVRHRIKLRHPFIHCAIERFPEGQEDRFYPLELCKIEDGPKEPTWLGQVFKEMQSENSANPAESLSISNSNDFLNFNGREECSQSNTSYSIW